MRGGGEISYTQHSIASKLLSPIKKKKIHKTSHWFSSPPRFAKLKKENDTYSSPGENRMLPLPKHD